MTIKELARRALIAGLEYTGVHPGLLGLLLDSEPDMEAPPQIRKGYDVGYRAWIVSGDNLKKTFLPPHLCSPKLRLASVWRSDIWQPGTPMQGDPTLTSRYSQTTRCGVYAFKDFATALLEVTESDIFSPFRRGMVFGSVNLWGLTHPHEYGYRASKAYPNTLYHIRPYMCHCPAMGISLNQIKFLSSLYGCEYTTSPISLLARSCVNCLQQRTIGYQNLYRHPLTSKPGLHIDFLKPLDVLKSINDRFWEDRRDILSRIEALSSDPINATDLISLTIPTDEHSDPLSIGAAWQELYNLAEMLYQYFSRKELLVKFTLEPTFNAYP